MKKTTIQRLILVVSLLLLFYISKDISIYKKDFYGYYYDRILYDFLDNSSKFIVQNIYFRDFINQIGSLSLDASMIIILILSFFHNPNKLLLSMGLFHGIRAIFLNSVDFPVPIAPFHFYPGYYALTTPFGRASDYYFSGHIGTALILATYMYEFGYFTLFKVGIGITFLQMIIMLMIRAHLFIDLLVGLIVSHFIKLMTDRLYTVVGWEF